MKRFVAAPTSRLHDYEIELTRTGYIRAVSFATLLMAFASAFGMWASHTWQPSFGLLIVTMIVSFGAIFVYTSSDSIPLTFMGVSVMSFAMGLMIGPVTAYYKKAVVEQAFAITVAIMIGMSILGIVLPKLFQGMGPYLMGALVFIIIARLAQIVFISLGFQQAAHLPVLAWITVFVFTLLVAYDWTVVLKWDYTWNNAFKASGAFILDALNLFLNLLEILKKD